MTHSPTDDPSGDAPAIEVELLYLDLAHCTRCSGAKVALEEAVALVRPPLRATGREVRLTDRHVTSAEEARRRGFFASPTVRVDGRDVQPEAPQSRCRECGELCACTEGVDCRVWDWRGERHLAPPVGLLVEALLTAANSAAPGRAPAPEAVAEGEANLGRFFAAREPATACCGAASGSGCCG